MTPARYAKEAARLARELGSGLDDETYAACLERLALEIEDELQRCRWGRLENER